MPSEDPKTRKGPAAVVNAFAVAWTLPFELVAPVVVGGAAGYLLDRWWHTKPIFMLVLGLLGIVIGIRNALRTASLLDKKNGH